jgi:stage II sporulation protein D
VGAPKVGSLAIVAAIAVLVASAPTAGAVDRAVFTVRGHGWGHGVGMGQYGALGYAMHGWKAKRILRHYYRGTRLGRPPASVRGRQRILLAAGSKIGFGARRAIRVRDRTDGRRYRLPGGDYRVRPGTKPGNLRILRRPSNVRVLKGLGSDIVVRPTRGHLRLNSTSLSGVAGGHWRGRLKLVRDGGGVLAINQVDMSAYLRGVVPAEIPSTWPKAALRAQAIAARSYAFATRNRGGLYDAYADTRDQMYLPIEHETLRTNRAVRDTVGRVVLYRGRVAVAFFSSSSGGRTASMQAAWGTTTGEPYLRSVRDRYDRAGGANPNHAWTLRRRGGVFARSLGLAPVVGFDGSRYRRSRRMRSITFSTATGLATLSGGSIASALGLKSTYFRVRMVRLEVDGRIRRGRAVRLKGRIDPRWRSRVKIQYRRPGGSWRLKARVHIGRRGGFHTRVSPTATREYRVRLRSTGSPVVRVRVR